MTSRGYVDRRIERTYRVRFDEAGPDGNLRSGGYLRFAQDLAWIHSESAGFGREWYGERGLFWLVRGVELEILDAIEFGSELVVSTEVIGFRRVIARRRSEIRQAGSERIVAEAFTDWVLLNDAGRPVRPPEEIPEAFGTVSDFTPLRVDWVRRLLTPTQRTFVVRRTETDPMAHVNNAGYLDYLDEQYLSVLRGTDRGASALLRVVTGPSSSVQPRPGRSSSAAAGRQISTGATRSRTTRAGPCSAPRWRSIPPAGWAADSARGVNR